MKHVEVGLSREVLEIFECDAAAVGVPVEAYILGGWSIGIEEAKKARDRAACVGMSGKDADDFVEARARERAWRLMEIIEADTRRGGPMSLGARVCLAAACVGVLKITSGQSPDFPN